MRKISDIKTIYQYNRLLGVKSLHPLISFIDLSQTDYKLCDHLKMEFYSVIIKEYKHEHYLYGRKTCDYSDGTVLFLSPGESPDTKDGMYMLNDEGWMLIFHPEFIRGTSLAFQLKNYSFFSYTKEEALHISQREKKIFMRCLENIKEELHCSIDKHSKTLITKSIELLLDYSSRFYERQFIIRCEDNKNLITKTEHIIDLYFFDNDGCKEGLPTAKYCAEEIGISTAYLSNVLKLETGQTINEYIESKRIEIAKKWLTENDKTISQIAFKLGFSSLEYFSLLFKKLVGINPENYQTRNSCIVHISKTK